jgi:hypothetical protein
LSSGDDFVIAENVDQVPTSDYPPPPLQRGSEDHEEEGIEAGLGWVFISPPCLGLSNFPTISIKKTDVEILDQVSGCLYGFKIGEEIQIQIENPDGTISTDVQEFHKYHKWSWMIMPSDPVGEYTVTVIQGERVASATINVTYATKPKIFLLNKIAPPGTTFQFALAGFLSDQPLYLYHEDNCKEHEHKGCWYLITQIPPPIVDSFGEALYEFKTLTNDPPGTYLLYSSILTTSHSVTANDVFRISQQMLIKPADGAILDNGRTDRLDNIIWEFDWSDYEDALKYHLYVIHPEATSPLIDESTIKESNFDYLCESCYIIDENRFDWTWKIRAFVNGRWEDWSETRRFDVEPVNTDPPSP